MIAVSQVSGKRDATMLRCLRPTKYSCHYISLNETGKEKSLRTIVGKS